MAEPAPAPHITALQVTTAALTITRDVSLAVCTIPNVATDLHIPRDQLSRYVSSQDDLTSLVLGAVARATLEGLPDPADADTDGWRPWALAYLGNFRRVHLQHLGTAQPLAERLATATQPGPWLAGQFATALTHGGIAEHTARTVAVDVLRTAARHVATEDRKITETRLASGNWTLPRAATPEAILYLDGQRTYGEVLRSMIDLLDSARPPRRPQWNTPAAPRRWRRRHRAKPDCRG